ncbi:MAG: hypothetical protein P4L46_19615 [Fimbriimonas sp.]|nr:hypothetical protein [Fimbriimonas sp.]
MLKSLLIAAALATMVTAYGIEPQRKPADKSVHHAAMHAEHWIDHHVSAAHTGKHKRHRVIHHKKSKSVHHAVMHAEHWIDHHVSAPHHTGG